MIEPRQKAKVALFLELLFQFVLLFIIKSTEEYKRNEVFLLLHFRIEKQMAAKSLALQLVLLELFQ
jgi:hypothetical protein